ncbi:unnamed protein product [Parajaminaea phylloscopi]
MPTLCSSAEVNLLVYHYLKESGFHHACFSLRHEGRLDEEPLSKEAVIEPGRLIRMLQKGLLYMAVETHVNPDGSEKACSAPFHLVGPPHICDGKSKSKPSAQPTPLRLTPEPPAPKVVTTVDAASQTTAELLDSIRNERVAAPTATLPNGVHSASNVASSSRNKLDSPDDAVTSKRKASFSSVKAPSRDGKRSKRQEDMDASPSAQIPNGNHDAGSDAEMMESAARLTKQPSSPTTSRDASGASAKGKRTIESAKSSKKAAKKKKKKSTSGVAAATTPAGEDGEEEEGPADAAEAEFSPTPAALGSTKTGGQKGARAAAQKAVPELTGVAKAHRVSAEDVTLLAGHSAEVFSSAWNPTVSGLIASAGGDATVRIWDIPPPGQAHDTPAVCKHLPTTHNKDVSALEWNSDGTLLASGSYDGILRLWTPQGDLHLVMSMHQGPIFAVRWNRLGTMLLTSSTDGTAIVWDLSSGKVRQQFPIHSDSVFDVDWLVSSRVKGPSSTRNDLVFATCSADNSVNLCRVGEVKPIRTLLGHTDEVNAIRFDASQTLLASASDDKTAKIWSIDATVLGGSGSDAPTRAKRNSKGRGGSAAAVGAGPDSSMDVDRSEDEADADADSLAAVKTAGSAAKGVTCKLTLTGHTKELYALEWAPTGPGSANPSKPRMLATTSFDKTARIWNADDGSCLRVIEDHLDSVYTLCWSPDAVFLATGGIDARVFVTRVADGAIVKAYAAGGQVFDVSWHVSLDSTDGAIKEENPEDGLAGTVSAYVQHKHQLAVAQSNRVLAILDLGKLVAEHGDAVATSSPANGASGSRVPSSTLESAKLPAGALTKTAVAAEVASAAGPTAKSEPASGAADQPTSKAK